MHPNKESAIQEFLAQTRKILAPLERLSALEGGEFAQEPEVKAARAWWGARYGFANRKKTRTIDQYLWFLLTLKSWASSTPMSRARLVVSTYKEAFLSPETERALALENRIEAEMLDACVIYVGTIDPSPGLFGFRVGKSLGQGDIQKRIAAVVADELIAGLYRSCAELSHADILVRCLWNASEEVYPGIAALLEGNVSGFDEQMREFVRRALGPQ